MLRQQTTERQWTSELLDENQIDVYGFKAYGAELFTNDTKFDSHCG